MNSLNPSLKTSGRLLSLALLIVSLLIVAAPRLAWGSGGTRGSSPTDRPSLASDPVLDLGARGSAFRALDDGEGEGDDDGGDDDIGFQPTPAPPPKPRPNRICTRAGQKNCRKPICRRPGQRNCRKNLVGQPRPPQGTPTPGGPSPVPAGSWDANGNTSKFGIPAGMSGNRNTGGPIWSSRCSGCHGSEKTNRSYGLLQSALGIPAMHGINLSNQQLADLTAYLNRNQP